MSAGGLASEVFDLFADDGDAAFVGGVELEDAVAEVVWAVGVIRDEKKDGRWTYPKSCRASARIVEVFPVPGGP